MAAQSCANCRTPVAGKYCVACGQRHDPHIHSIREFMHEATETLTHADSRVWRTLWPLLFKPGFLTIIPYYTYRAMLRVFAQGKWLTRLKFTTLAFSYIALGIIMAMMLSFYTMVTL